MKSLVIKAGKAEIEVLADLVSGEGSHPGLQEASFVPWVPELFPGCLCECSESIHSWVSSSSYNGTGLF